MKQILYINMNKMVKCKMDTKNNASLWPMLFEIPVASVWVACFTLAAITDQSIKGDTDTQLNKFFLQCASLASIGIFLLISQHGAYRFDIRKLKNDFYIFLTIIIPFVIMFLVLDNNKYNIELTSIMAKGYISYGLGSYISLLSFVPNMSCFIYKEIERTKQQNKIENNHNAKFDNQSPTNLENPIKPVPMKQIKLHDELSENTIAKFHGFMKAMLHISNIANTVSFQFFFLSFFSRTAIFIFSHIHIGKYNDKTSLVAIASDAMLAYVFAICAYRDSSINRNSVQ